MQSYLFLWFRSLLFYVGFIISTVLWGTSLTVIALFFPLQRRFGLVIVPWVSFVLWWLRISCAIRVEVEGKENLGSTPSVLFIKHMSTWDALFSQLLISPQTTVIKQILLWVPCFGWAFWVTKPISISRSQPVKSLKQLLEQGKARLEQGYWVSVFPEGSRIKPGEVGRFQLGGARLAKQSNRPAHVVAHNGGLFWIHKQFIKRPGTIKVIISPAMTGQDLTVEDFNQRLEGWMRDQMTRLDPNLGPKCLD